MSDAIDKYTVDAIHIPKLTPEEWQHCFVQGLCFCCQKKEHNSTSCPMFPSSTLPPWPKKTGEKKLRKVEDLLKLEELEDDDEDEEDKMNV